MFDTTRRVLLITLDQWRADCLSAAGHPLLKTPHLDALASDGALFRKHYGQATPCGPARASLLTGLYLHNHRSLRNGTPLDYRHPNIATEVRKAGLHPVLFGYTDTSLDPREHPQNDPLLTTYEGVLPGFSVGTSLTSDLRPWLIELQHRGYKVDMALERQGRIWNHLRTTQTEGGSGPSFAPAQFKSEDSDTSFVTDRIIDHLGAYRDDDCLIFASYLRPHPPLVAPAPYHALYAAGDVPPPRRKASRQEEALQHPWLALRLDALYSGSAPIGDDIPLESFDEPAWRQLAATYFGLIAELDDSLGRLFNFMKQKGLYDETLIILTADHGEQLGEHWLIGKEGYFDASFHVPLIIRDPKAVAAGIKGRTVDAFTEAIDIVPTILDWLGSDVPRTLDGHSLLPFLHGADPTNWRSAAHWGYDFRDLREPGIQAALGLDMEECGVNVIRDDRYKYVHFSSLPPLFFDLGRDRHEFNNVAEDPAYQNLIATYARKLLSWRMQHEDRTLSHMHLGPGGNYLIE